MDWNIRKYLYIYINVCIFVTLETTCTQLRLWAGLQTDVQIHLVSKCNIGCYLHTSNHIITHIFVLYAVNIYFRNVTCKYLCY